MVKLHDAQLDSLFGALADPTRRAIVRSLAGRARSVSELAEPFDISLPGMAKHIQVLENAGLIRTEKLGRTRTAYYESARMRAAEQWLHEQRSFWEARLDALERFLVDSQDGEEER